jgi:hypothetical protein
MSTASHVPPGPFLMGLCFKIIQKHRECPPRPHTTPYQTWDSRMSALGFELRASRQLGRCSMLGPQPSPFFGLFALVIFQIGQQQRPALDLDPPTYAWDCEVLHHTRPVCPDGVSITFCLGWPQISVLLPQLGLQAWATAPGQSPFLCITSRLLWLCGKFCN